MVVSTGRSDAAGGRPALPAVSGCAAPFGNGRTRTVRGIGADTVTVTPRRARCADCQVTQILLPTALTVRRADSTEAIGNALVAHARGGVRDPHAQWLYRRAWIAPPRSTGSCWSGRRRSGPRSGTR